MLLATCASVVPFALWDMLAVTIVAVSALSLVRRLRRHKPLAPVLSRVVLLASLVAFLFVAWALNHYAPPLASELGLEVGEYTTEELAQATSFYLDKATELAPQVPRDKDGELSGQDFYELAQIAGSSYEALGKEYDVLNGPGLPVKALLVAGETLLYSGHTGIYFAPTGEASVPLNCATADMPFIMCHEAAHRLAIASEQEANFCAFLACVSNDDVRFEYAGYYQAFVYCYNALYRADANAAQTLLEQAAQSESREGVLLVVLDRQATSEHYDAYEGPFKQVGSTVNDNYLKSFGQSAGVRSYGLVVDYLIAWNNTLAT